MVGASGFEPPTCWSRTIDQHRIKHLARLRRLARGCAELPRLQTLTALSARSVRNGAQQREAQGGHKRWSQWSGPCHDGLPTNIPPPRNRFRPSRTGPGTATLNFKMAAPSSSLPAIPLHSTGVTSASGNSRKRSWARISFASACRASAARIWRVTRYLVTVLHSREEANKGSSSTTTIAGLRDRTLASPARSSRKPSSARSRIARLAASSWAADRRSKT
jgi:hypothetical protein